MSDVTVATPSVPGREAMLVRCLQSVDAQTYAPARHLVGVDYARAGHGARVRNSLLAAAETEWVSFCDDDDWFLPDHLRLLRSAAGPGVDVVVSDYALETGGWKPSHQCDPYGLELNNWFHPSCALVRREAALDVGGFPDPDPPMWDDWALWRALYRAGAGFACVHEVTNVKGVHPGCINGPRE